MSNESVSIVIFVCLALSRLPLNPLWMVGEQRRRSLAAATKCSVQALEFSSGRDVEYAAAFALSLSGDSARARALVEDLDKRFPEDTSVRFDYLPTLRVLLALKHNGAQKAVEPLQVAAAHDFAVPGLDFFAFFGGLYPAYVRGTAYLNRHQGQKAAEEFQKIIDHRGIVAADPIGSLAHLQLGRAYTMQGDMAKAKSEYQEFFALLKDADPGISATKQAREEYADLQ